MTNTKNKIKVAPVAPVTPVTKHNSQKREKNIRDKLLDFAFKIEKRCERKHLYSFIEFKVMIGYPTMRSKKILKFLRERKLVDHNNTPYLLTSPFFEVVKKKGSENIIYFTEFGVIYVLNLMVKEKFIDREEVIMEKFLVV